MSVFSYVEYRAEIAEVLRTATLLAPMVTFDVVTRWLDTQLKKPLDIGEGENLKTPVSCVCLTHLPHIAQQLRDI